MVVVFYRLSHDAVDHAVPLIGSLVFGAVLVVWLNLKRVIELQKLPQFLDQFDAETCAYKPSVNSCLLYSCGAAMLLKFFVNSVTTSQHYNYTIKKLKEMQYFALHFIIILLLCNLLTKSLLS